VSHHWGAIRFHAVDDLAAPTRLRRVDGRQPVSTAIFEYRSRMGLICVTARELPASGPYACCATRRDVH
jgi:hypothetical protein